jgi:hypothetical protein
MNLISSKIMKSVEESSCYGLDVLKNSYSKESIHRFMYGVVQP